MRTPDSLIRSILPRLIAAAAVLAIVAGCSSGPAPSPTAGGSSGPSSGPSTGPSSSASGAPAPATLILRVTSEGGFINPAANLATLPEASVYSDGTIITPGPVDAIYPGPLVSPAAVRNVGPGGEGRIVAAIRAAGLDKTAAATGGGGIPGDTGTTVFSVNVDGTSVVNRLVLTSGGPPGLPGGAGGSLAPGVAGAKALLDRLTDPTETWGAASAPTTTLQATAFRIYVAPGAPSAEASMAEPSVSWPLATPLDAFGTPAVPDRGITGLRQGAAFGADAATLAPVFAKATQITPFSSGGKLYALYVRPLLPDEVPAQG